MGTTASPSQMVAALNREQHHKSDEAEHQHEDGGGLLR